MHNCEAASPSVSSTGRTAQMENPETLGLKEYTFGTWNVQGLNDKNQEIECYKEIKEVNADVIVLTETKLPGQKEEENGKYRYHYSGYTTGNARAGVCIAVKNDLGSIVKWNTVSERIITAKINILGQTITLIGVYGANESGKSEDKKKFEDDFKAELEKAKKEEYELIILGDFNSWVGISTSEEFKKFEKYYKLNFSNVVGEYGDEKMNPNGKKLIRICYEYGLKIQNTFFNNKDSEKFTCYQEHFSSKSIIDFCITRQNTALKVKNVFAWETDSYKTDHKFLKAIISFSSKSYESRKEEAGDIGKMLEKLKISEE